MTDASLGAGLVLSEEIDLATSEDDGGTRALRLAIPGLKCGGCIVSVEKAIKAIPGVIEARANLSTKSLRVSWETRSFDPACILTGLSDIGFEAFLLNDVDVDRVSKSTSRDLLLRMAVAGFAATNVMLLSVSVWAGADGATRDLLHWLSALIALPAVTFAGKPFFNSAMSALRARRLNMDVPISVAVILAVAISLSEVINGGSDAYFDAAITLVFLLLIGRWLDQTMREKARSAAQALARLSPRGAWVIDEKGQRQYTPVRHLRRGDRIALDAGARLPVDGIVEAGTGTIDAALVTGESALVPVKVGDHLDAGILSRDAVLTVRAVRIGEDTTLAEISRLCAAAEDSKSAMVRLADQAASIYAPLVHLLALATLIGWLVIGATFREGTLAAVAVLIVTCPCALGLAAPMAQAVASGTLFRRGIMLKDGAALERLACVDHAVFDKTGVLTTGQLSVVDAGDLTRKQLSRAVGLAESSTHPVARAVAEFARMRGVVAAPATDIVECPGLGMRGKVDDTWVRIGSAEHCNVAPTQTQSQTVCWYAEDGAAPIQITLNNPFREGAQSTIGELQDAGIAVTLLSGDAPKVAERIGGKLGIERSIGGVRPEEKIAYVDTLKKNGETVLMVGDGINDAPALTAANVSMAPSSASDIGRTASDLVFTGESLDAVPFAWQIAKRTRRVILQNFGLAAGYNSIAVPIAAIGYAGPLEAAVLMSTSSLLVTLNALRLKR